jgi:predicted NBD/HSP70 family sugar kinase
VRRPIIRAVSGNQATVRAINRASLLNLLRQHGTLSRQELVNLTGLSSAAVTGVVASLLRQGLVVEARSGEPRGGRPPVLLEIAHLDWHAAGIKVMEHRLEVVLTDLHTETLARSAIKLPEQSPPALARSAAQAVTSLLESTGRTADRLVGIGVAMAGVIDPDRGVCVYSPFLQWQDVPVRGLLEAAISRPVWVDNDVNALATAEMLFGRGQQARNFAVVTVGRGIGAGLVIDGKVYRGNRGGAGEFGHTVTDPNGRECECGRRGCLEAYASEPALIAQGRERFPDLGTPGSEIAVEDLVAVAQRGHEGVRSLLAEAGERVGIGLANLVNLFNPDLLVIGGEGVRLGEHFFGPMKQALRAHIFTGLPVDLPVYIDPWGDDAWARGAAGLAIQESVFARPLVG